MKSNMDRLGGLHNSQRLLLALTQAGEQRESAYRLVQRNAMKVWDIFREVGSAGEGSFKALILSDTDIMSLLTDEQVQSMFDDEYHLKHVETIFNRVFN
jgi:adenylosuccinate lyase